MAPKPLQSSRMELYEPSLTKPNPLRIVKHPKTQSYGSPNSRVPPSMGGLTGPPDSPPEPPDKPLIIRKLRKKKASILDNNDEGHIGSVILAMVQKKASPCRYEGVDKPPRLSQNENRAASIGNYVKEELFKGSSDSELTPPFEYEQSSFIAGEPLTLVRTPSNQGLKTSESSFSLYSEDGTEDSLTPKRRLSRSRRFLQKAIGGFDGARSKSMHLLRSESSSKDSKETLIRRVSRKNHNAALSSCSVGFHPTASNSSFNLDSAGRTKHQRYPIPNFYCSSEHRLAPTQTTGVSQDELLVPKISVLQGSRNITDGDENTVWVAIEVTGTCVKVPANDQTTAQEYDNSRKYYVFSDPSNSSDIKQDYLYDMKVHIRTSAGCTIESLIGDIQEPRTIKNKQSELLIAKIRFTDNFTKTTSSLGHTRHSSETLIAELESRLVASAVDFLDVTLTYKHSAFRFLQHLNKEYPSSIAHQTTKLVTEARAIIKRNDSLAAWSPRALDHDSPLSDLIRSHFPGDRAEGIIQRISSRPQSGVTKLPAMIQRNSSRCSSEGTITPTSRHKKLQHPHLHSPITTKDESAKIAPLHLPVSSSSDEASEYSTPDASTRELDPARKIWSDMRRNSKGMRPAFSIKTLTDGFSADDGYMDLERQRIKEQAVRNKRSLGADTLRSMVGEGERDDRSEEAHGRRVGGWVGWGPPWW